MRRDSVSSAEMAHTSEFAATVAFSPERSPSDALGDTRICPIYVKIPRDQKNLLGRYESWASFLSQRSNGFVNVPPDVLEQVKRAYTLRRKSERPLVAGEATGQVANVKSVPEPTGSDPEDDERDNNQDQDQDQDHEEDLISWPSSSHEAHVYPSRPESELSSPQFTTQIPDKSPQRPTVLTSSNTHHVLPEFPDSSQGPEDDLELQVPNALSHDPMPVNRSALPLLATPPSAQVVPCTLEQSAAIISIGASKPNIQLKPQQRKAIYKPVPELYRPPKQNTVSSHLHINNLAPPVPSSCRNTDLESSLSAVNTSSIIPSTHDASNCGIQEGQGSKSAINSDHTSGRAIISLPSMPCSPVCVSPSQLAVGCIPPASTVASISLEAPFICYKITYPSYSGTILEFVTACMYIQLQYRKIKTCLYDDFIRAWVEGFLPYVRDCDESQPPRKALRAIDWYNEIDDDLQFTSRVVTRHNLGSVLDAYPKEVQIARQALGLPPNQGLSQGPAHRASTDRNVREADFSRQPRSHVPPITRITPARISLETDDQALGLPLTARSGVRPLVAAPGILAQMPFNHSAQSQTLKRSLSESISQKRKIMDNFHLEEAKRVSLSQTSGTPDIKMWSDSGDSVVSSHLEQCKEPTRTSVAPQELMMKKLHPTAMEDAQEKRRRRLEKHFKKKALAGSGGIVGTSAPTSNGPKSAQRSQR
jgi:hypothetical protein